jgi:CheY-like chemotaxis protein
MGFGTMVLRNCRVLVVEDCPDQQRLLLTRLKKEQAGVELECSGAAAVDAIRRNQRMGSQPFDAVIMDLFLSEDDGITATRAIKAIERHLPIIAITAHSSKEIEQEWRLAGCSAYLEKPLDYTTLLSHLVRAIRESQRDWLFQVQLQQMIEARVSADVAR